MSKGFDPEKCGTYAGVHQHRKYKTPACELCKTANRMYQRRRRHARGESKGVWFYVPDHQAAIIEKLAADQGITIRRNREETP